MDNAPCNLIYVDRSVRNDRVVRAPSPGPDGARDFDDAARGCETQTLRDNVALLLESIGDVQLCATSAACMSALFDRHSTSMVELRPTVVLIDVPHDERLPGDKSRSRSPSPHADPSDDEQGQDSADRGDYGIRLLQMVVSEAHQRNMSSLVVPITLISYPEIEFPTQRTAGDSLDRVDRSMLESHSQDCSTRRRFLADHRLLKRCLDWGAADVMTNPLTCVTSIQVHAYRAHKEAAKERQAILEVKRGRKRSWVGVDEQKPFAYLREAMVSGLMNGICRPGDDQDDRVSSIRIMVSPDRRAQIAKLVAHWHFCAHDLSDDDLIVAASSMLKHALAMPELERWRMPTDQLATFLIACRAAYNSFVPYHNFRHVVDVMQATFHFLVQIGTLPPFPSSADQAGGAVRPRDAPYCPMAGLLQPFEALTLLITAVGHDVGHPGVNNGFLVTLNAPLAQLYNDRSVLESFHCAAYSQILRRHWPAAFEDLRMRNLMISSILATDMGLHFDYMKQLDDLQEKLQSDNTTEGWNGRMVEEQRALVCALLIKCADISNVARKHDTALKWTHILSDEFSRQASMESELEIPSSLMAPPKKDVISRSKAQLGFMDHFAIPLFQGVADILPQTRYCVDELEINKALFEKMVEDEIAKQQPHPNIGREGTMSPRTMSIAITTDADKDGLDPSAGSVLAGGLTDRTRPPSVMAEEHATNSPCRSASYLPEVSSGYQEVNGIRTTFEAVADFAASDPFNIHDTRPPTSRKQRSSEATEESASAPAVGDWASQATSATTGKMPLSPSTQGTSIISRESLEQSSGVPVTAVTAAESAPEFVPNHHTEPPKTDKNQSESRLEVSPSVSMEEDSSASTNGKLPAEGKSLKKKPSRFRMNAFPFFRRHKGASPPLPAADTAG